MSPAAEFVLALLLAVFLSDSCVMEIMLLGMIGMLDFDALPNECAYVDVSSVDQFTTGDDSDVCLLDWAINALIASQYSVPPCLCRRRDGAGTVSGGVYIKGRSTMNR